MPELAFLNTVIGPASAISDAAMGDYDNDGDLDVAVFTSGNEANVVLNNDGGGNFRIIPLPGSIATTGGAWGDHDNDGDLDLAVMTGGQNYLFITDGGSFQVMEYFGNLSSKSVDWSDINNDGLLDVAVGNEGGNQLFINSGSGFERMDLAGSFETHAIKCGDVNNDGLPDLVTGNHGPDYFFRNLGTGHFVQVLLASSGNTNSIHLADIDRDGFLEIITGEDGTNHIYNHQAGGTFSKTDIQGSLSTYSMMSADMDLDGFPDLLEGNRDGENRVLLNDGMGAFTPSTAAPGAGNTRSLIPGDFDRDGDADVLACNSNENIILYSSTYNSKVRFDIDVGSDGINDAHLANNFPDDAVRSDFGVLNTTALAWGDYDNDGDRDLAVGNYGGQNFICTNDGNASFVLAKQFSSGMPLVMTWGDYDNDGDLDLAVGNNGQNHLFTRTGSGFDQRSEFGPNHTVGMKWADVNLDGRLDMIVINHGSQSKLYLNQGLYFEKIDAFGSGSSISHAVGDFDGDGDPDIAVGKFFSEPNKLFRNMKGENFQEIDAFGNRPISAMSWADFDKDGDLDLAVSHKADRNALYRNNGVSFSQEDVLGHMNAISMETVDYNLDGNCDVIMASSKGIIEIYLGDGSGGFLLDNSVELNTSISRIAVADGDGDAYPDIALATTDENLFFPNMGNRLRLSGIESVVNNYLAGMETRQGNLSIPIDIESTGPGRLILTKPRFDYTIPPGCYGIPSVFSVYEDTLEPELMNLAEYFYDDIDRGDDMSYSIIENSLAGIVDCYVQEDHYLTLDALSGEENDNYTGDIELVVEARDSSNLSVVSDPFSINIMEVNDEPAPDVTIPDIQLYESVDHAFSIKEETYFVDGDGDFLYYDVMIDPLGEIEENVDFTAFIDGEMIRITTTDNGTCTDVPLWIFADDDADVNTPGKSSDFIFQKILVTIRNVNDPPHLKRMDDVYLPMNENLNDAFNIGDYVTDVDTAIDELVYKVDKISDEENFEVALDWNNFVDIKVLKQDFEGNCHVVISVWDGEYSVSGGFDIFVRAKNNPPTVSLLMPYDDVIIPTSSVSLMWEGNDSDGDQISYDVYFSRSSTGEKFYRMGYKETSMVIDGILDDTTYYWKVIPHDLFETGTCVDGTYSFTVDLDVDVPKVTLLFPEDGATIGTERVTLSWSLDYPGKLPVSYDILLYEKNSTAHAYMTDLQDDHVAISGLKNNTVFSWTVIPRAGRIQGECISGTYSFRQLHGSGERFPVEILFEDSANTEARLVVFPGEQKMFNISLNNLMPEKRRIDLVAEGHPGIIGNLIFSRESFILQPSGYGASSIRVHVSIQIPDHFGAGTFTITVMALSGDQEACPGLDIICEVKEKGKPEVIVDGARSNFWVIPLILVILVLSLVLFVVITRRRTRFLAYEEDEEIIEKSAPQGDTPALAYSLRDGTEITVEALPPKKKKSFAKEISNKKKKNLKDNSSKKSAYTGGGHSYPVVEPNPYRFFALSQYPYLQQYGFGSYQPPLEEYLKGAREYYAYVLSLERAAVEEGADTSDAGKLLGEMEEKFDEARTVEDYQKIFDYCNAVGNAVNRALSRLEKGK
ncbi:MAG: FG-GAP-like repeat-containing protein [Candidatus Thermoplasmatota archaeon]|nr:FG-GAP-like repeat-containing protein [Candidatus Thermoplasmatota archaeon]